MYLLEFIPDDICGVFLYSVRYPEKREDPKMLLKSKVCLTVLAIYEMVAVSVLHFQRICDAMFATPFCDSWYRYFLFCIIVPLVVLLILMWVRELIRGVRRRRFIRRAKSTVNGIMSGIRGKISENINTADLERVITAAILVGIKKYADRHPNLRHNVNHIMDVADGNVTVDLMSTSEMVKPSRRRPYPPKRPTRSRKK